MITRHQRHAQAGVPLAPRHQPSHHFVTITRRRMKKVAHHQKLTGARASQQTINALKIIDRAAFGHGYPMVSKTSAFTKVAISEHEDPLLPPPGGTIRKQIKCLAGQRERQWGHAMDHGAQRPACQRMMTAASTQPAMLLTRSQPVLT